MSGRIPESPGIPQHTGSLPKTFASGPFATRPIPPYPTRRQYAAFDPACPPTHTASGLQSLDANRSHVSAPPTLETAPFILRERIPNPDRTMDELTDWMSPPVTEPRPGISEPIAEAERQAAGASDIPNGWAWIDENRRRQTAWYGHDNSYYAIYGGRDNPNETAAVANDSVMQSIEPESDPLVALRQLANNSQEVIRRQLDSRVTLEDQYRELSSRLLAAQKENINLVHSQQEAADALALAQMERDRFRRERDLAQNQVAQLRPQLTGRGVEQQTRGLAQQSAYEEALERERDLLYRNRVLRQGEAELRMQLQQAIERETGLRTQLDRVDNQREQFEMERDHYWTERDREQNLNRGLQAQIHDLSAQLAAAQALANGQQLPANRAPVAVMVPNAVAPVVEPPVVVAPAGSVRGEGSGRSGGGGGARRRAGGRGGRKSPTVSRKQPGRNCKVQKSYKS